MTRRWEPGDVAMVSCSDGEWRQAVCVMGNVVDGGPLAWLFADGARRRVDESAARHLVVIDPEDEQQVLVLTGALAVHGANPNDRNYWRETRAALRDLIAEPKPSEPTDVGAVVKDVCGDLYVRSGVVDTHPWVGPDGGRYNWSGTGAVAVLSKGFQP